MKKKWISLLLSTTMAMGMIAGTGVTALADGEPEEITWMFWDDVKASQDLVSLGYGDIIDRFNETYDGQYHVNIVTTNLTEYETKLSALIAAGDTPDVFICNPGPYMKRYVDTGAVADLTDTLKTDEKDWYDTFNPGVFDGVSFDDKICAVPINGAIGSLFYNTQIFEEQGIEVPKTYDELIEACKKLQDAGISPIACSVNTTWVFSMMAGYLFQRSGCSMNAINAHEENWTDDKYVAAAEKAKDIAQYSKKVEKMNDRYKKVNELEVKQMTLFDTVKDDDIIKDIKELDISNMTPIDALNILYKLQGKVKNRYFVNEN